MKFIGVDLHKKTISLCVMMVVEGKRKVAARRRFDCRDTAGIREFFERQCPFRVVVEATANYEWFLLLVEDLAERCVLAHPKKLRVIAESTHKSDRIDAQILAEFLALDMVPEAYRPSPRIRQYRVLVRHRRWLQGRITSLKCKLRHKAAHYNADVAELFSARGQEHLAAIAMSLADRFETQNLLAQWTLCQRQLAEVDRELRQFAKTAPAAEREARAILDTMSEVGPVTIDVVLSELGDWRRFRNAKRVVSYAGLDPGSRESRRQGPAVDDHQGRFATDALGAGGNRLAAGEQISTLAECLREVEGEHGIGETCDCGRGPTGVVRDVCDAA